MNTDSTQPIPGRSRVTVLISGEHVPGTYHGMTTDLTQALVGIPRSTTPPHLWPSLSPGNGKCVFRLYSLDLVSFTDLELETSSTSIRRGPSEMPVAPSSIVIDLGPVKIGEGEIWRSNRGKHERFEIVEDVYDGQDVKLLGIDTPGYKRETAYDKFFKYYYKDDNGSTPPIQTVPNPE